MEIFIAVVCTVVVFAAAEAATYISLSRETKKK